MQRAENFLKENSISGVSDLFQNIGALCKVRCGQNQQLQRPNYSQFCLGHWSMISWYQQAERQSACRWRYWKLCWCFELIWNASALNVSSQSCLRLKTALATTPRADVTTKMLKLLVRSTQISVQEQIFNFLDLKVIENCHLHDFLLSQVFHGFLPWRWPPGWACILGLVWWSW